MRGLLVAASAQDRSHDRSNGASLTSRPGRDVRGIGSQTFADAVGDSPYAPDIGAINIANDDAGNVTLKIEMWPFMYLYSSDTIAMFFDTDLNLATGSSIGAEYALLIDGWDNTYALSRWTGSTWDFSTPQSTFSSSYYFGSTIVFNRTDLGSTSAFGLNIVTSWRSTYSTYYDFAPETGSLRYDIVITPPAPAPAPAPIVLPTPVPAPAPAPASAADPIAAAAVTTTPNLTLSVATARTAAKAFVRSTMFTMPLYHKDSCAKSGKAVAKCRLVFDTTRERFVATARVENWADGAGTVNRFVEIVGTRTNKACVTRLRKANKPTKPCTKKFNW